MDKITKSVDRIIELSKGFEKGDDFIPELIEEIRDIKKLMQKALEEDERIKAQKQAS